jgi:hypothetical protein
MQVAHHISLESSWWGLQLCFRLHFNQRSSQKFMGLQSHESPNFENSRTPKLGISRQNDIWVQAMWPCIENTIRGKVVASPNSGYGEFYESMYACDLSVHQKCSNYTLTNLLFGLCRSVWIIDPPIIHLSPHPGAPTRPSTPKMLWVREHTLALFPCIISPLDLQFTLSRSFGCVMLSKCMVWCT